MGQDPNILPNVAPPSITTPPLTEGRKEEMLLPEAEVEVQPTGVLSDTSVTLDDTIPKMLKEAYNNSFVALAKPEILNQVPQKQLLEYADAVKNVAKQMLEHTEEESQVTLASQMLATNEVFLQQAQRHYQLYLAPGAIHEEQTNQDLPTIENELEENKPDQEGLQNAFTTIKNIAMKALVLT